MFNLAKVYMDGFVSSIPVIQKVSSVGKDVCHFYVAVNHFSKKEEDKPVSYIYIECWENLAVVCQKYLKKGSRVTIDGNLKEDRWIDYAGNKNSRVKVVADNIRFG